MLPPDSPALHLIQRVRDEAHRFAITGHRRRARAVAARNRCSRPCPGSGRPSAATLLQQFGGLQGVLRAGVDDLGQVHGIGPALAQVDL